MVSLRIEKSIQSVGKAAKAAGSSVDNLPRFVKFFRSFDDVYQRKNERNTILVTAFGTGVVAPIVLTVNPVSKEDSNTKKYTALRQPISALFAVITQVGINAPIPKFMNKLAAKGWFGYDYLPDFKDEKMNFTQEEKDYVSKQLKAALDDKAFKQRVADNIYKNGLEGVQVNCIKDVGYFERLFNPQVRARIKKQIMEGKEKVKKLNIDEVGLEHAIKYTSKNLSTLKNLTAIGASVAVLWPTFSLLNYVYPRFVERCFPHLVKEKKAKEASLQTSDNKSVKGGAK